MKKKELALYKNKTEVELKKEIAELRERATHLRFDLARGKTNSIQELRQIKKNVAQLLTIERSKES